jgi:FSR family fosmidomycin resistance protein-like MFS transporter
MTINTENRPTQQGWFYVLLLSIGHFLNDFYNNFLPPLLPLVAVTLGLSLTTSGFLVMVYSFTASMLQPICGYFVDKSSYTWLILLTLPISAVFICFSGLAPTTLILFICVALSGIASSLFHPLGSTLVGKVAAPHNQVLAMSVFIGTGNLGFAIAPALIIFCLVNFGVTSLPWMIAPALIITVVYYVSGLHRIELAALQKVSPVSGQVWYKSSNLLKLNAVMALRSWSQVAVLTFLPLLLAGYGHTPLLAGNMLTVYLLGGVLGGFVGGYLSDKIGQRSCVLGSLFFCLPLMYAFFISTEITSITWLLLALSGAALQSSLPASIVWAQNIIPNNAAMASGMMLGLSFGLGGVGTALTGAMADLIGLHSALLWTLAPLALAIPLTYSIPEKQLTTEDIDHTL